MSEIASEFHTTRRVEFADTDMGNLVHFSRFFVFMETAEHEFLSSWGPRFTSSTRGARSAGPVSKRAAATSARHATATSSRSTYASSAKDGAR